MKRTALTVAQVDRAVGAVVGLAVGNALGGGYAFEPRPDPADVHMRSGGLGPYAAGEWGDDTAMAIPILQVLREGMPLLDPATADEVVARWVAWRAATKDVAPVVASVLAAYDPEHGAASLREAAVALHAANPVAGSGNASLMRTTPVVLGALHDPQELSAAARAYSDLTHGNPVAGDACVLWNLAQRQAILSGECDLSSALPYLPPERRSAWELRITQAEVGSPEDFAMHNGWAPDVLQSAWSAVVNCSSECPLEDGLRLAVSAGGDTPTVAAVTGGLLGARWGVSAIPLEWRRRLSGWPGYRDRDLVWAVRETLLGLARPAHTHPRSRPDIVAHPNDAGMWLGTVGGLQHLPPEVTAVVSLCPVGSLDVPRSIAVEDQIDVWLVDSGDAADNPCLDYVIAQTVDMLVALRSQGQVVYLHSAHGRSRLPLIAALYGARMLELPARTILHELAKVLPGQRLPAVFEDVVSAWD